MRWITSQKVVSLVKQMFDLIAGKNFRRARINVIYSSEKRSFFRRQSIRREGFRKWFENKRERRARDRWSCDKCRRIYADNSNRQKVFSHPLIRIDKRREGLRKKQTLHVREEKWWIGISHAYPSFLSLFFPPPCFNPSLVLDSVYL